MEPSKMAGHSQFKNIMHRKGAQDAKRGKIFTKIIREITVAAKESPDPDANPRLRSALAAAREANMPKDNVERALKKAAGGGDDVIYEVMRYEGYGPSGVAIIVDALTDNRNRTASEVRSAFTKHGGNLGESNSVSFMFQHIGFFRYPGTQHAEDQILEIALEVGADDVKSHAEGYDIVCASEHFHQVRDALMRTLGEPKASGLMWFAQTTTLISDLETAQKLIKLIDALEDNDDVQKVSMNGVFSPDVLSQLDLE